MKHIRIIAAIALPLAVSCSKTQSPRFPGADPIVVCGDTRLLVIDLKQITEDSTDILWADKDKDPRILWTYSNESAEFFPFDECKPRDNWHTILLSSSKEAAAVLDTDTGELEFNAYAPMAHSIERLPGDRIAVAMSNRSGGNRISIFDFDNPRTPAIVDSMYSGHGAVWMRERRRFYTVDYDDIREYKLLHWKSDVPEIRQMNSWHVPAIDGHDLVRVDKDNLLVTDHDGTYIFDLRTEKYTPFEPLKGKERIKSANWFPEENLMVYTKAEVSWWTHHIYILHTDTGRKQVITIPDVELLYKVRR